MADDTEFVCRAINDFYASPRSDELDLFEGEEYLIMQTPTGGWWYAVNGDGEDGWVPANYLERVTTNASKAQRQQELDPEKMKAAALEFERQKTERNDPHVTRRKLSTSVVNYESQLIQQNLNNHRRKSVMSPTISRRHSIYKERAIEQEVQNNIKKIKEVQPDQTLTGVLNAYAFRALNTQQIKDCEASIIQYFAKHKIDIEALSEMSRKDFVQNIATFCKQKHNNIRKRSLEELYAIIGQYAQYHELQTKLLDHQSCDCCCNCNDRPKTLKIEKRTVLSYKLILSSNSAPKDKDVSIPIDRRITVNVDITGLEEDKSYIKRITDSNELERLEVYTNDYTIYSPSDILAQDDELYQMNGQSLNGLSTTDVVKLLQYEPLPFDVTFKKKKRRFRCCVKTKKPSPSKPKTASKSKWSKCFKFMKLSVNITAKTSSILDTVTDLILLYKASTNGAILFTMLLSITLLAPYILSYSSGVQIFLHRKTFQNVELFTFQSLLLTLYLFPTGVIYFILLDLVDVLFELYKWFAYGCMNKIKSPQDLIQMESNVAEYFGMSRMNWFSFKKQKLIAQLFFESIPQVVFQALLFSAVISGRELSGITDQDLMLSIGSASFNCCFQLFRLSKESEAARETFVEYSLNCITARFGWVPFVHKIEQFAANKPLKLDYKIEYSLPLITFLSKYLQRRLHMVPLQITKTRNTRSNRSMRKVNQYRKRKSRKKSGYYSGTHGSVQYDFSPNTINKLITTIKELRDLHKKEIKGNEISIAFGESLRLLDVRSIISLMQTCHTKHILLPDIDKIDWIQPFNNTTNDKDIRLFSNTFDKDQRSLLISLYLTGYGTPNGYSLLKQFVRDHDVPINVVDDKGNTIIHHMIRQNDYDAIYELLNVLKLNQKFHFDIKNDAGDTVIHEMIKQNNCEELTHLLNIIHLKLNQPLILNTFNHSGESLVYLAMQRDWRTLKAQQPAEDEAAYEPEEDTMASMNDIHFIVDWDAKTQDIDPNKIEIEPDTLVHIIHFMIYRIEYDHKKKGTVITTADPQYIAMKKRIHEITNGYKRNQKPKVPIKRRKNPKKKHLVLDNDSLMHRVLINYDPQIIASSIHAEFRRTALGNVLNQTYFDDIGVHFETVVNFLLQKNAPLFYKEVSLLATLFIYVVNTKFNQRQSYFDTFEKIINRCNISVLNICDNDRNNPLHNIIKVSKKEDSLPAPALISVLSYLCDKYPEWMSMRNKNGFIPLYFAIQQKNIDLFYLLCRYMSQHNMDVKVYLRQRLYVKEMVQFGSELLKNERVTLLKLLFATFDYSEIFIWSSKPGTFNPNTDSQDLSLIKFVSTRDYKHTIEKILFEQCSLDKSCYAELSNAYTENQNETLPPNETPPRDEAMDRGSVEEQKHQEPLDEMDDYKDGGYMRETDMTKLSPLPHSQVGSMDWIELVYSTVVETFSALDLYTDVLILMQLYYSRNQWWSTWMLILLASPYLVSHGSLVVILQHKLKFHRSKSKVTCYSKFVSIIISFWESLLMTPMAVLYLVFIDLVFMLFALLSTLWLLFAMIGVAMCCKKIHTATKYDIRDWIDRKVFQQWLDMNRTEIIGYRRLRTLSQLFFETIPQIVLQLRILWVIEWSGDHENTFKIEMSTLIWSIGLAFAHLILEGGMIYLDKCAFKMGFMEYSLECLGGRVQWVPFQHLLPNIIENQVYIHHDGDPKKFDKRNFDAESYRIHCNDNTDDDTEREKRKHITLNYEQISAQMKCMNYSALYQFSPYTMNVLIQILINCPEMTVPLQLKLGVNMAIENLFKHLLCRAEIRFGLNSFGTVDALSLCNLYRASFNKIKLSIQSDNMVTRLKPPDYDEKTKDEIKRSLINLGEIAAVQWVYHHNVSAQQELQIKRDIVTSCVPSKSNDLQLVRLDILRNCYKHHFFVGTTCDTMKALVSIVDEYYERAKQEGSWYFVIMFILLYSRGTIFGVQCTKECCALNPSLIQTILQYFIPTYVEINGLKIPFTLFESCQCYRTLYRKYVEELLINNCKQYMIASDGPDTTYNQQAFVISEPTAFDVVDECTKWSFFAEHRDNKAHITRQIEKLMYQLNNKQIENWCIILLDKLVFVTKMYIGYNTYLQNTESFREFTEHNCSVLRFDDVRKDDFINIEQLIPNFDADERYQIYQLTAVVTHNNNEYEMTDDREQKEEDPTMSIFFESTIVFDTDTKITNEETSNRVDLWVATASEPIKETIVIDARNAALARYNYHLLHYKDQEMPVITIESQHTCEVIMQVKYTKLYQQQKPNAAALSIETAPVLEFQAPPPIRTARDSKTSYRNRYHSNSTTRNQVQEQIKAIEEAREKAAILKYNKLRLKEPQKSRRNKGNQWTDGGFSPDWEIPDDTPVGHPSPAPSQTDSIFPSFYYNNEEQINGANVAPNQFISPVQSTLDAPITPYGGAANIRNSMSQARNKFRPRVESIAEDEPPLPPATAPAQAGGIKNAFDKMQQMYQGAHAERSEQRRMANALAAQQALADKEQNKMDAERRRLEYERKEREDEERRIKSQRDDLERKKVEQRRKELDGRKANEEPRVEKSSQTWVITTPTSSGSQNTNPHQGGIPQYAHNKPPNRRSSEPPNRNLPPLIMDKPTSPPDHTSRNQGNQRSRGQTLPTNSTFLTLSEAQELPSTARNREDSLSPDDFHQVFGMTKEEFKALKQWKQNSLKKRHGLF